MAERTIGPLRSGTRDAYAALVEKRGGVWGGWGTWFHTMPAGKERTVVARALKERLVCSGHARTPAAFLASVTRSLFERAGFSSGRLLNRKHRVMRQVGPASEGQER